MSADAQPARQTSARLPLVVIFVTIFVDMLGYGMVIPLLPFFVQRYADGGLLVGMLGALYALAQAFGGPLLAGLSDRFGRRPVLLLCLCGTAAGYLLLGCAETLWLLIVAFMIDGLTGSNMSTAQAFVADSTAPEERAWAFGLCGAAFGMGIMAGPAFGGLLSQYGLATPAFVAAGIALANLLFAMRVLPESLPHARRVRHPFRALNPVGQMRNALALPGMRGLLLTIFLLNLSFAGLHSNFPVFSAARFGWDASQNAYFFAFVGVCAVTTQALLLGRLRAWLGEQRLLLGGLGLMAASLLLVAVAPHAWMLYIVVALAAVGSNVAIPTLTSRLSAHGEAAAHGQRMGALQTTLNGALIMGPLLAGVAFDYVDMAAPYALGGMVALGALGAGALALRRDRVAHSNELPDELHGPIHAALGADVFAKHGGAGADGWLE